MIAEMTGRFRIPTGIIPGKDFFVHYSVAEMPCRCGEKWTVTEVCNGKETRKDPTCPNCGNNDRNKMRPASGVTHETAPEGTMLVWNERFLQKSVR